MDLISTHCSTCYSWTVCRAPLPAQVFCGVCDPNPPPPPAPLSENQRTDIMRMVAQLDPQLAVAAGLGVAEMPQQLAGEPEWDCVCGTCGKVMNDECGGMCDRREGREFYETCNACADAEECDDDEHNVAEHCPTCDHRAECEECGDPATGRYGPDEHIRSLCADCRDDGGFCSCGNLRDECPYCEDGHE